MKSVSCFRDLEQFGIRPLTGEADALSFRILCDLTEQGVRVFKECFGMDVPPEGFHRYEHFLKLGLNDNWNSGGVASVMLSDDSIRPLAVMGFYLRGKVVVITDTTVFGLENGEDVVVDDSGDFYNFMDDHRDHSRNLPYSLIRWPQAYGTIRRIIRPKASDGELVQGTRNVHQMTGRVS